MPATDETGAGPHDDDDDVEDVNEQDAIPTIDMRYASKFQVMRFFEQGGCLTFALDFINSPAFDARTFFHQSNTATSDRKKDILTFAPKISRTGLSVILGLVDGLGNPPLVALSFLGAEDDTLDDGVVVANPSGFHDYCWDIAFSASTAYPGAAPLAAKVNKRTSATFDADAESMIKNMQTAKKLRETCHQYHQGAEQCIDLIKAGQALMLAKQNLAQHPDNQKLQEEVELAQRILSVAASSPNGSVSLDVTKPVGSGGGSGPMGIMGSEYADVIGFLDHSETEFRDQTGHVTHVNRKSKISPKHYSEWKKNRTG